MKRTVFLLMAFFALSAINAQSGWQTVLFDDFNRADGDLGENYEVIIYPETMTLGIINNEVKVVPDSSSMHAYWTVGHINEISVDSIRLSCILRASADSDSSLYSFALSARDSLYYYMAMVSSGTDSVSISIMDNLGNTTMLAGEQAYLEMDKTYFLEFTLQGTDLSLKFVEVGTEDTLTLNATDESCTRKEICINGYHYSPDMILYFDDYKIETYYHDTYINKIEKNSISIYPNPANDKLLISGLIKQADVSFYSLDGKLIRQHVLTSGTSEIDITDLSQGSYVVKIKSDNKVITKRLIKE